MCARLFHPCKGEIINYFIWPDICVIGSINSHYFHIIGDGYSSTQFRWGLYIPIVRISVIFQLGGLVYPPTKTRQPWPWHIWSIVSRHQANKEISRHSPMADVLGATMLTSAFLVAIGWLLPEGWCQVNPVFLFLLPFSCGVLTKDHGVKRFGLGEFSSYIFYPKIDVIGASKFQGWTHSFKAVWRDERRGVFGGLVLLSRREAIKVQCHWLGGWAPTLGYVVGVIWGVS